jgi:hypothetical protein
MFLGHLNSLTPFHLRVLVRLCNVAVKNNTYLGPYEKCPIFLPDVNQIQFLSVDCNRPCDKGVPVTTA